MLGIFPAFVLRCQRRETPRMRVSFPLSLKFSLWLVLNLLLLAAIGGAFLVVGNGSSSLDALVRGPSGERVQAAANLIVAELRSAPSQDAAKLLARLDGAAVIDYSIVDNDTGEQIAGRTPASPLPDAVTERLRAGRRGRGPPDPGPPDETPPGSERVLPRGFGDPTPAELSRGRSLLRTTNPISWWLVVRMPPLERDGRPAPVSLLAHTSSLAGIARLLELKPWLYLAGAIFGVSLLFWFPLVHGITRDLRRLSKATEHIAEGKFDTRVPARRRDEIGHLGESVNTMAARLDTLVNGQKRFLGDVAHELGSPLARLQVATEILESRADASLREQVSDVREEVQQMAALVSELLAFTKAGLRARDAELRAVSLGETLAHVLERENARGRVRLDLAPELHAFADRQLLARALANLVRNALRYAADAPAPIAISARRDGSGVRVCVEDEGPGVPAEALARLGEPFYRPESARTRETGGVGLGLAIVRSCVNACGGDVQFSNRSPRGFRAEIRLAAAAAKSLATI